MTNEQDSQHETKPTPKLTPHPSVFPGKFGLPESPEPSPWGIGVQHAGAAWITGDRDSLGTLSVRGVTFPVAATSRHIRLEGGHVYIENVTVFPGSLTHREALTWALIGFQHRIGFRVRRVIHGAKDRLRRSRGGWARPDVGGRFENAVTWQREPNHENGSKL